MLSGKMYRFRTNALFDPKYLELWLLGPVAQKFIDEMKTGINESGLNLTQSKFLRLPVPAAPLEVQRRIIAVIEEQLTHISVAERELQKSYCKTRLLEQSALSTGRRGNKHVLSGVAHVQGGIQKQQRRAPMENFYPFLRVPT